LGKWCINVDRYNKKIYKYTNEKNLNYILFLYILYKNKMSKEYDYCIIGAGPTGLTLAYLFSKIGK
jgi:ribulose 1,5-bisphosphate synthetase/thiazole synthase